MHNDIERYDFWHREKDAFLKQREEEKANEELRKVISQLVKTKISKMKKFTN